MLKTLIIAFQIAVTSSMNSVIYTLKKIPIVGKWIPQKWYSKEGFKKVMMVLAVLLKVLEALVSKFLYVGVMIFLVALKLGGATAITPAFFHIFFCLTLIGACINTNILSASSQKYYAVIVMHMNTKKYVIADEIFYVIKTFLSFLPSLLYFVIAMGWHPYYAFALTVCILAAKIVFQAIDVFYYEKKGKVLSQKVSFWLITVIVGLGLAYGLVYLKMCIPVIVIMNLIPVLVLLAIPAICYLLKTEIYEVAYKKLITYQKVFFNTEELMENTKKSQFKIDKKDQEVTSGIANSKKGYDYFNYLFFSRHRKMLLKSSQKLALAYFVCFIILAIAVLTNGQVAQGVKEIITTGLPYFVFLMYLTNRGSTITQAMFVNCDNSMLTYAFYRDKKVILEVFKQRVKTITKINLIPTIILAIGLPILLLLAGGDVSGITYFSIFTSILFMGIFFSVHYLTMYYLLQPYDIHMNLKSVPYMLASFVTYLLCIWCIKIKVDVMVFSVGTISLTIIYLLVAMYLVYRYAPKTFRLK